MGILTDIKSWAILILVLVCSALYGWGYLGWNKYEASLKNVAQLEAHNQQLEASIVAIKESAEKQLKKKADGEKEYRTAYLFEKKQVDNMYDPDASLGCEESTQKAIDDVLKIKETA